MLGGRPNPAKVGTLVLTRRGDQADLAALLEQVDAKAAFVVADDMGEVGPAVSSSVARCLAVMIGKSSRSKSSFESGTLPNGLRTPRCRIIGG